MVTDMDEKNQKFKYTCEVCGKIAVLTPDDAYRSGWDYPPFMGAYGIVSPRTCPDCEMLDTVWAALVLKKIPYEDLTEKQKETVQRRKAEPESMEVPKV